MYSKYLKGSPEEPTLKRFANITPISKKLNDLVGISEPEKWSIEKKNDLIHRYLFCIFDLAIKQEVVFINSLETMAVFNTGLLTLNGQDIFGKFVSNKSPSSDRMWYLENFYKDSDRSLMKEFRELPRFVQHFLNPADAYYNTRLNLKKELDHILDDNFDRLPSALQTLDSQTLRIVVNGAIDISLKKIERNNRLVVPQIHYGKVTYLMPIDLVGQRYALAVEKLNDQYRANTIFTVNMAYMQARLIAKPESDWLIPIIKSNIK